MCLGQSVSVQACSSGVEYHELSSSPCFRIRRSSADHVTYECQRWRAFEVAVGRFLFDLARDQSISHFHTFTVTFVDVFPSSWDGLAACS